MRNAQSYFRVVLVVGLVACLAACVHAADAVSTACEEATRPTNWRFVGGGFHMKLEIDYPLVADNVSIEFNLPRAFFIDAAEAEQQYRMLAVNATDKVTDLTGAYSALRLTSDAFFDIEAPVFKVNYTSNHVEMDFAAESSKLGQLKDSLDAGLKRAVLEIPIHARYEELNAELPLNITRFLTDDGAYVTRCLEGVLVTWQSTICGGGTTSAKRNAPGHCVSIPVGVLSELPFVYHALMALLVLGAAIIVVSI